MLVRDAKRQDLPVVVDIYNEQLHTTTSIWSEIPQTLAERLAWFEARERRGFPTLVAELGGRVIGVAAFGDFRDSVRWRGYRYTVEHSVHVAERSWAQGVGRTLMHALFERAEQMGIHVMIGGIDSANHRSLRFHEQLGFREVGRLPETGWKHGRRCDLVFVQRFIDSTLRSPSPS
jgi:L-amino acid N-acyltransferase